MERTGYADSYVWLHPKVFPEPQTLSPCKMDPTRQAICGVLRQAASLLAKLLAIIHDMECAMNASGVMQYWQKKRTTNPKTNLKPSPPEMEAPSPPR